MTNVSKHLSNLFGSLYTAKFTYVDLGYYRAMGNVKIAKNRNSMRSIIDRRHNPIIIQTLFLNKTKISLFVYTFQYSCDVRPDFPIPPKW